MRFKVLIIELLFFYDNRDNSDNIFSKELI